LSEGILRVFEKVLVLPHSLGVLSIIYLLNTINSEGEKKHKKGGLNCVFKNFSFLRNKNCSQGQSLIEFRV